eukprot:PhM_4_TR8302/c0_g1_i1/m.24931
MQKNSKRTSNNKTANTNTSSSSSPNLGRLALVGVLAFVGLAVACIVVFPSAANLTSAEARKKVVAERRQQLVVDDMDGNEEDANISRAFRTWPQSIGVQAVDPAIALVQRGLLGYALQCQDAIPPNTTLLYVPYRIVMTPASLDRRHPAVGRHITQALPKTKLSARDAAMLRIAALVWMERRRGLEGSKWGPWIHDVLAKDRESVERNLFSWSSELAACQGPTAAATHRSVTSLVKTFHSILHHADADPEIGLADVQWLYTVIMNRAWERPEPEYFALIPAVDLTNVRSLAHGLYEHLASTSTSSIVPSEPNADIVFDDKKRHVVLYTTQSEASLSKGKYIFTRTALPTDAVRLYGFFDPNFKEVISYASLAEYGTECAARHRLTFDAASGEPSALLLHCVMKMTGGDEVKAYVFLKMQLQRVLSEVHSTAAVDKCREVAPEGSLVVRSEEKIIAAYIRARAAVEVRRRELSQQ